MAKFNNGEFEMKLKKFMEDNNIRELVIVAHSYNDRMIVLQAAHDKSLSPILNHVCTVATNILLAAQQEYKYTMN